MEHPLLVVNARNLFVITRKTEGTVSATEAWFMRKKVAVLSTTIAATIAMTGVATDLLQIGTRIESTPETTRTGIMGTLPRAMTETMTGDATEIRKAAQEMIRDGRQEQEACQ